MKECPECGTQYEDHISQCLVDGADLTIVVGAVPANEDEPKEKRGGGFIGWIVAAVLLLVLVGGGAWMFLTPGPPPPTPEPKPVVVVPPPVAPAPVVPKTLQLTTVPSGAEVSEGDNNVCTTPCTLPLDDEHPLPRTFTFALEGHTTEMYVAADAGVRHQVRLSPTLPDPEPAPTPRPRPIRRPRPSPAPVPGPVPVATPSPKPAIGSGSDLKNPFGK